MQSCGQEIAVVAKRPGRPDASQLDATAVQLKHVKTTESTVIFSLLVIINLQKQDFENGSISQFEPRLEQDWFCDVLCEIVLYFALGLTDVNN